jgi:large subunit ribosomal protein L2
MDIKFYKPYTPSLRNTSTFNFSNLSNKKPEKLLTYSISRSHGRNNQGKITIRHKGGGHKQLYRKIDFKRDKINILGLVNSIQYDPNRNVNIALIHYLDGEKRYILHPELLKIGDYINSGKNIEIKPGNTLLLDNIPLGIDIHNLELLPKKGGQIIRAAGTSAKIIAKENNYVIIKLPSKELRIFNKNCSATIGKLSNSSIFRLKIGKAGRNRWLGIRPTVRGSAMNPVDHPHGGGEGKSSIGKPQPRTPWGKIALGLKTRRNKKSDIFILHSRS